MNKTYIGDGVYCEVGNYGDIVLTTENGIETTNIIVLENREWKSLIAFVNNQLSNPTEAK